MQAVLAYVFALLIAPGVGASVAGALGALALASFNSPIASFAIGAVGALLAFVLAGVAFEFLNVYFGWIAWGCVLIPLALNEGRRMATANGPRKKHEEMVCSGTLLSAIGFAVARLL